MNVAFTICSNNYLAKAKVVADTFITHHPDYEFLFFLVDIIDNNLDYSTLGKYQLIQIHKIVPNIEELATKYNIVELNTAVKPAIFLYFLYKLNINTVIYLDPDLMIFNRFVEVEEELKKGNTNLVITPHFCSPIDDGKYPSEIDFMPFGLYNLGFIAIKNSIESKHFLKWWHERLMKYCYIQPDKAMFTDQLWVNYAPLFFNGVSILKHLGYNVANWNLYEREITVNDDVFYINQKYELKFFHFSNYQFDNPYIISKYQNRHNINDKPYLRLLIDKYQTQLIDNKQADFSKSKCYYNLFYLNNQAEIKTKADLEHYTFRRKLKNKVIYFVSSIFGE